MTDNEKDIDNLMCWLSSPPAHDWDEKPSEQDRYYRALDALIAERDALKQRVAELEAKADDRDRDLRERLMCAALTGILSNCDFNLGEAESGSWVVRYADATLAAMRKGESNGK